MIPDTAGEVISAISMSIPKIRLEQLDTERMSAELRRAADSVSEMLRG
ncbi:MAG: hypothetical protein IT160_11545 [Bryobacterales bacterium]|nr:hypothetical protein [Bryobacterales bacterium]